MDGLYGALPSGMLSISYSLGGGVWRTPEPDGTKFGTRKHKIPALQFFQSGHPRVWPRAWQVGEVQDPRVGPPGSYEFLVQKNAKIEIRPNGAQKLRSGSFF